MKEGKETAGLENGNTNYRLENSQMERKHTDDVEGMVFASTPSFDSGLESAAICDFARLQQNFSRANHQPCLHAIQVWLLMQPSPNNRHNILGISTGSIMISRTERLCLIGSECLVMSSRITVDGSETMTSSS